MSDWLDTKADLPDWVAADIKIPHMEETGSED
jgi:hypothetical protein